MKIASVERVVSVREHTNADSLELATVLGWQVVCKKGEFKAGDLVVYVNIDSVLDPHPHFAFLAKANYRIKPVRLRGEISQGICFKTSILADFPEGHSVVIEEGADVSSAIGAKHYEKPVPAQLAGVAKGPFPPFLIKTDEDNLRNYPNALSEIEREQVYISLKMDGTSATYYAKDGAFGVCSRNLELLDGENVYWEMARKYGVEQKLLSLAKNVAVQGEIYGPGIQGNPSGAGQVTLAVFNVYDIDSKSYYDMHDMLGFAGSLGLETVMVFSVLHPSFDKPLTMDELVEKAKSLKYDNGKPAEGLVIRTVRPIKSETLGLNRWSGKVLNELYEL